jgi:purine nucleosidase
MKKKIILDCDPGHDDAVAIMLAAAHNDIEILGITCVAGNATLENTKKNALKVCSLIGKTNIPIFAGAEKPINYKLVTAEHVHGKSGLDTEGQPLNISEGYSVQEMHAVDFIINTCHQQNEPIILCPVGPLTNIALALQKDPSIKFKIKEIVFMGGAAMCLGNITPVAEFNIYVDPHAANVVLNSGVKLVMFGLDVTHKVNVNDIIINDIKSNQNKSSILFAD